jgi:hypothetical protein
MKMSRFIPMNYARMSANGVKFRGLWPETASF